MRVNPILADQLDEAFTSSKVDHQATANKVGAGMNGELVLIQAVRSTGVGKAEPQEPTLNLSLLSDNGRTSR